MRSRPDEGVRVSSVRYLLDETVANIACYELVMSLSEVGDAVIGC